MRKTTAVTTFLLLAANCAASPDELDQRKLTARGYYSLGHYSLSLGDLQNAETLLSEALAARPGDPAIRAKLDEVHRRRGSAKAAIHTAPPGSETMARPAGPQPPALRRPELVQIKTSVPDSATPAAFRYWIQIGYLPSAKSAERHWQRFAAKFPEVAGSRKVRFLKVDGGVKIRLGPYEHINAAGRVCRTLRRAGQDCFPGKETP